MQPRLARRKGRAFAKRVSSHDKALDGFRFALPILRAKFSASS